MKRRKLLIQYPAVSMGAIVAAAHRTKLLYDQTNQKQLRTRATEEGRQTEEG